jgi:Na+/H+ antiporter NhaC
LKNPGPISGFETTIDFLVKTVTDTNNLQVLLFLFLFSGLIKIIQQSGGTMAFAQMTEKKIHSKKGVFYTLWGLLPLTFIDCGFRVVGAGSIIKSISHREKIAPERLAFQLNNTASPVVELIPFATTFVGFNVGIIQQSLSNVKKSPASSYSILLHAIPLEFFSITVLIITFLSIFFGGKKRPHRLIKANDQANMSSYNKGMGSSMENIGPKIKPRLWNLIVPLMCTVILSIWLFWYFEKSKNEGIINAIASTEPNKAMLVALLVVLLITSILYAAQGYKTKKVINDVLKGGNEMTSTLVILITAWSMASVTQDLGLGKLIEQQFAHSIPPWVLPVSLFIVAGATTYFIGSGWGAASLIMPFALPLAETTSVAIPICVAAVITGGTFGDVTSPVAGMTSMAANVSGADHSKYIKYASNYNFLAAGISIILFVVAGFFSK